MTCSVPRSIDVFTFTLVTGLFRVFDLGCFPSPPSSFSGSLTFRTQKVGEFWKRECSKSSPSKAHPPQKGHFDCFFRFTSISVFEAGYSMIAETPL
jgi:hypothetical protein